MNGKFTDDWSVPSFILLRYNRAIIAPFHHSLCLSFLCVLCWTIRTTLKDELTYCIIMLNLKKLFKTSKRAKLNHSIIVPQLYRGTQDRGNKAALLLNTRDTWITIMERWDFHPTSDIWKHSCTWLLNWTISANCSRSFQLGHGIFLFATYNAYNAHLLSYMGSLYDAW